MMKLAWLGVLALAGCTQVPETPDPGREIYMGYCVSCHGADARGDGPLAGDLPVHPSDLTGLSARNGGVFPSVQVMAQIYGYPGRYQTHVMPEFGPELEGRNVQWSDETGAVVDTPQALLDLKNYLETIQE
ncbi:MAG: cytochrome c [Roseovarius sp.]|nr:cytochrome c [Roseovarius sp.]